MSRGRARRGVQLLLEVLFGMGLFAVAILLIISYLPISDRAAVTTDQLSQATNLARSLLDTSLDQDYHQVQPLSGTFRWNHAERRGSVLVVDFVYNVAVSELNPPEKLKDVVVTVSWRHGARNSQVRLRGRKCDYW